MALEGRLEAALAFEAPYVIDRLVRDRVVATRDSAAELFTEAKKYLVLCAATPDKAFDMCSALVDEAWHAFVLFTTEYTDYGQRYFGSYVHHAPAGERGGPETFILDGGSHETASFDDFCRRYEELFGHPLPAIWYDSDNVAPCTRVINDMAQTLTVTTEHRTVHIMNSTGDTVLSVDEMASEAVKFIVNTHAFYVRELPGDLTAAEKAGMIEPLVRLGVLRLAP
ncbi:hypothetical protein AU197_07710 [Mycobacterium sp. IS-1590]|uniref:glycine-rich domain-containing protein n=1 Tax=Mycobacterium sp. IS-1590 TaxID=1772286 RepID=UPI000749A075|nr:hypothetical protein [Mycobacterium sp. IS-1590]KUI34537.1 hypothetical protein AU197_07710 [Mycobacterium sp. IS-1590]